MTDLYQIFKYLYEDKEQPNQETRLVLLGQVVFDLEAIPIHHEARVQVEYLWPYTTLEKCRTAITTVPQTLR